jgi:hypothetical protein
MDIYVGALLGLFMFLNVWLIIWPKQQIVMASATQVAEGGEPLPDAAGALATAGLASRTNTLFSITAFRQLFKCIYVLNSGVSAVELKSDNSSNCNNKRQDAKTMRVVSRSVAAACLWIFM